MEKTKGKKGIGMVAIALALCAVCLLGATVSSAFAATDTAKAPAAPGETQSVTKQAVAPEDNSGAEDSALEEKESPEDEAAENAALAGKATLTEQEARDIALAANAGATIKSIGLEDENGVVIYEAEMVGSDGSKIEFKINATDGSVLPEDNDVEYEHED